MRSLPRGRTTAERLSPSGVALLRGMYKRNTGEWRLVPWGDEQKQTLAVYVVDSDPGLVIPDGILKSAQTGSLPDLFKAVRNRVVALREKPAPAKPAAPAAN